MTGIYHWGDFVLIKGQPLGSEIRYLFSGAQPLSGGEYSVCLTLFSVSGYAGGGSGLTLTARPGDSYRLGEGFSAYTDRDGRYGKKSRQRVTELRFDAIAPDCLELSFR